MHAAPAIRRRALAARCLKFVLAAGMALVVGLLVRHPGLNMARAGAQLSRYAPRGGFWAPCNRNARRGGPSTFTPLPDPRAAALVIPTPEVRPDNSRPYVIFGHRHQAANFYVPTRTQLARFRRARTSAGEPILKLNPYLRYVDGRDGLRRPSTDELIQWAALKWGIPVDWLRAEFTLESYWSQFQLGDETAVSARWYRLYPAQARVRRSHRVWQSLGIAQVKWIPNGSVGAGTEPLRWESTAFNVDFQAATVRFYFDNPEDSRSAWGDHSYVPCQRWGSIGGWYEPYPWRNAGQESYVAKVKRLLADRAWTDPGFLTWSPPSLPPGVRLR